jgi:hypothetical protein
MTRSIGLNRFRENFDVLFAVASMIESVTLPETQLPIAPPPAPVEVIAFNFVEQPHGSVLVLDR